MCVFLVTSLLVSAQTRSFKSEDVEYELQLPSPTWHAISRVDVHRHFDFMNGDDETNGYLRVRKLMVEAGKTPADLFRYAEKWELKQLPGYVVCTECSGDNFEGNLRGAVFSYEYAKGGEAMAGRIYYLQVDQRTFYSLRFSFANEKLQSLREQMDFIAGSFRMK